MPLYKFHVYDGRSDVKPDEIELPGLEAARRDDVEGAACLALELGRTRRLLHQRRACLAQHRRGPIGEAKITRSKDHQGAAAFGLGVGERGIIDSDGLGHLVPLVPCLRPSGRRMAAGAIGGIFSTRHGGGKRRLGRR